MYGSEKMRAAGLYLASACLACAGPTFAKDAVTAQLAAPLSLEMKVIAGGAVFKCLNTECAALTSSERAVSLETCKALAKRVGTVTELRDERRALSSEKLKACNVSAARR